MYNKSKDAESDKNDVGNCRIKKNNTGKIQKTLSGTVKWSVRYKPNSKKKRCIYMRY